VVLVVATITVFLLGKRISFFKTTELTTLDLKSFALILRLKNSETNKSNFIIKPTYFTQ
jgi:hypothetical protein